MHKRTTSRFDRALEVSTQISNLETAAVDAVLTGSVDWSVSQRPRTLAMAASRDAASRAAVVDANVRCGGALCRRRL